VVSAVVGDGVDLRGLDELLQLDQMRLLPRRGVDLVLAEQHVLARANLVSLGDPLIGHVLAILGADSALLDARFVLGVKLVKVDAVVLGRRMHLDRHDGQAERQRAVPDRTWHGGGTTRSRAITSMRARLGAD
jgi:hypothetical protein